MSAAAIEKNYETVYPASDYHEDWGPVLWWHFPLCEPPVVGVYDDHEASNGWLTHFSRMPIVWNGEGHPRHVGHYAPATAHKGAL